MMRATPGILVARSFPGAPEQVGVARRWLQDTLTRPPGLIPDAITAAAVLLLSEAVTNAIRHTATGAPGGSFTVHVHADRERMAVAVQDGGSAVSRPERMPSGPEDGGGRGLALVAAFAETWGPLPDGSGLAFSLALRPESADAVMTAGARGTRENTR